jgi:phage terminase large subunit-like protein
MIPKENWVGKPSSARGVADAYDTMAVRHKSGGTSLLTFKSYEQGRGKFQGKGVDFEWWDEEPPDDVYQEGMARLIATGGCAAMTFTPLNGMTLVVTRFFSEQSNNRALVQMTIDDALHIPAEERAQRIADMKPHEREARAYGVPMLGEGRIFQTAEETLVEPAVEFDHVPQAWTKVWGVDFGIAHPFAAALMAWDRDTDTLHLLHCIRFSDGNAIDHAKAINAIAAGIPIAWPHDGNEREKGSGEQIAVLYRQEGLPMMGSWATHPEGGYSVETGIMEMDSRMKSGRWKVAEHLGQWREEYRGYHRKNGLIVKERDDLISASRYAMMMKRSGQANPLGPKQGYDRRRGPSSYMSQGLDFDLFTGA